MPSPKTLHERIYLTLRTSILSGEFKLGARLTESKLAKRLQVSRTPVREAIRRLQQERLLTSDSPDGVTIVEISLDSAIHLYDCRIALEQLAVTGACFHATPAQLEGLEQNLLASEAALSQQVSRSTTQQGAAALKQLDLNYEFHQLIAEASQNPWAISLLDQLSNQVQLLRLQILEDWLDVEAIQKEHWQLFRAIKDRDEKAARKAITDHLEHSKKRVIQVFQSHRANYEQTQPAILCPSCRSSRVKKNGHRQDRQNYLCKDCGRQFIETMAYHRTDIDG